MRKTLIAIAVASAALSCSAAYATTLRFRTTSTAGVFQNGGPDPVMDDTSARFGFDVSFMSPDDLDFANGFFADGLPNAFGQPEMNTGFAGTHEDYRSGQIILINPDHNDLMIMFDPTALRLPIVSGTYSFVGGVGETASGSFVGLVSGVPLPASAPMLGGALVLLGAGGLGLKRRFAASASTMPSTSLRRST